MNALQIFESPEFGQIRTVEVEGEPWLVGKDVAEALGYSNPQKAIRDHVEEEDRTVNGTQGVLINESGLYSLVLSSKLPTAKKFRRWVTAEVLPSIRKHGAYMTPAVLEEAILNPDTMIRIATELKAEREKRVALEAENEAQRQLIQDFEPVRQYVDQILACNEAIATSQIAADYGLSARRLNQILHEAHLQHNVNGQWILYREHMGKGYTKSKTINITYTDGRPGTRMMTYWTQKGRLRIHEILTAQGIQAVMDQKGA